MSGCLEQGRGFEPTPTPEGRSFFEKSRYESFLPLDEETMKQIDPYVHVLLERKAEK